MTRGIRRLRGATLALAALSLTVVSLTAAAPASAKLGVTWMKGYSAPGTPAKYDKVGVIKVGARRDGQERARARARHLGRSGLLRPLASGSCPRPRAGRCGRWSGARTCSRTSRSSTWPRTQGDVTQMLRLLPRLPHRSEHHQPHPPGPDSRCVRASSGD